MTSSLKNLLLVSILLIISGTILAQKGWREIETAEDLYQNYPELIENMFEQFNLDYPGFEEIKTAVNKSEYVHACDLLLQYYRESKTMMHLRRIQPDKGDESIATADTILQNIFTVQEVKAQVQWLPDGHRDWYQLGPNMDKEWAWLSNRHEQLNDVVLAWFSTGNPKYLNYADEFLRDFIIKSQPYPAKKGGGLIWRGLEVSFRVKVWAEVFYGLINNETFSSATKLLILSSLPDHADYNRKYHAQGNWLTMELSGLGVVAANFPEYKLSDEWLNYAMVTMNESLMKQVYPDGVQTELTSHYHRVAWSNFEKLRVTVELSGGIVPDFYTNTLEKMVDYLAKSMRPNGFGPLNNDSDMMNNRDVVLKAAETYDREDWVYIATNGRSGVRPDDGPSFFYPWAGQLISRSSYDEQAQWSFFDVGPWGSGHEHCDKMHLSVSAFGKDFLVDGGRYAYSGDVAKKFRRYAVGSESHNTILIDHNGQSNAQPLATEALDKKTFKITDCFDFATGSYDRYKSAEGKVQHSRSLLYVRGEFWLVVDRITTDRPRHVETLWHWHPECEIIQGEALIGSYKTHGNLALLPVGDQKFDIDLIKGQEEPSIQGWYSPTYNVYTPNVTSSYSAEIQEDATFVWVLQPYNGVRPEMSCRILSETDEAVKVEVVTKSKTFLMTVPYNSSEEVSVNKN